VQAFPHLAYQVYFADQTSAAAAELNADIRRTLRATLRTVASPPPADFLLSNSSYLVGWKNVSTVSLEKMCMLFLLSSMWMLF
jgi:soluble epoxide hydrolase/lipid-phosphate phosphatase